jgi:ABC-type glycerol-3-phosphate transport system substrate-binding protein
MKRKMLFVAVGVFGAALLAAQAQRNPTKVVFWHSMAGADKTVNAFASEFNASQNQYAVDAQEVGSYTQSATKLVAALRAKTAPALYQAEIGFFPKLADDGVLADLASFEKNLEPAVEKDFFPAVWNYGIFEGKRYGLPWNSSTPVLFYNASLLRSRGLRPPNTWAEFASLSKALTNRTGKGFIAIADSWQFEQMVLTRGGNVVLPSGQVNFNSKEVLEAAQFLQDLVRQGSAIPRSLGEAQFAILDFVRTKAHMAIASIANWPDILPYSVAFELGATQMPIVNKRVVPFGGAQLVVLNDASPEEKAGAWAFWQFLMKPENIVRWTKAGYYVPVRRSVLPLLNDWYKENPYRKVAFEQFDEAVPRPRTAAYAAQKLILEEALERILKGGGDVRTVLEEAQRRALAVK